jgi:tRNA dimethylallyltransferase
LDVVRLAVICGPTAAGKSTLAMQLAESLGGAILSADSRQVYRGFDLGTAKPTADDRRRVPHAALDVAEPTARYSAAQWSAGVDGWLHELRLAGRDPWVVGGTGLYLRTLSAPLFEEPALEPEGRAALAKELESLSLTALRERCQRLDPERAHLGRTQLLRAIEVATLTGIPISRWHRERARPPRHEVRCLYVDPGEPLQARIVNRVDRMLAEGWVEEVEQLAAHLPDDAPAWNATGYQTIRDVVRGTITRAAAREAVVIATRQYAKRQRTWFRHQLPADAVTRLEGEVTVASAYDALGRILDWVHEEHTR